MTPPQIALQEISKSFAAGDSKIRAVDDATFSIDKGEFVSIVGHSGSGKTTLLSIIGGIIQPSSGSLSFEGKEITSLDDKGLSRYRSEKVGFMFQFASLLPALTALENALMPTLFSFSHGLRRNDSAREYLDLVGLGDKHHAYPSQLSGGQQRRVAIARALINTPALVLADEPTGDLDEETESEIMALFRNINRERKITFIFITHNLELARQARRCFKMVCGRISETAQ